MSLIKCPDCGKDVSDTAPSCLNCGRPITQQVSATPSAQKKKHSLGCGCLILIAFLILLFWLIGNLSNGPSTVSSTRSSQKKALSSTGNTQNTEVAAGPMLELVSSSWRREHHYAIYEGQVKNISSKSLENVVAVASFYDAKGQFITSSDAIIDYNPILAGQTSPFKVMKSENPAMNKAGIEFKYVLGGTIPYRQAEETKPKKK